jgi:hypothetical protein
MQSDEWSKKKCRTCGAEFTGQSFMTQCRECYWHLKGFSWQCPKSKVRHTPEDLRLLTYGWPFGSGMWGNKEVLLKIEAVGGFEQYSYENWDEIWRLTLYKSALKSLHQTIHDPPIVTSGPCLLCVMKQALTKAKETHESILAKVATK